MQLRPELRRDSIYVYKYNKRIYCIFLLPTHQRVYSLSAEIVVSLYIRVAFYTHTLSSLYYPLIQT